MENQKLDKASSQN